MATILGIDYGRRRIGVAVSDPGGRIASPLSTIEASERARAIAAIRALASEHEASEIVVGMPRSLNGSLGPMAEETLDFVEEMRGALDMPVRTWDERLTTAQAERAMISADMTRAGRKRKLDKVAAQIMLQSYLDNGSRKND
ncbi:MAG: Holliday junction resolvase RuvX [Planctomycetota bacterium]|nr:MAG: Holliday junction resolvase RuvX [Planctomycetota bacterium]